MSIETNKHLVYRFFTECVSGRNLDVIDEVMAPDIMDHRLGTGNLGGTKATRQLYGGFLTAFPDGRADEIALIGEGDHVFWYGWGNATHTGGSFMGGPSSGKRLEWAAWDYFHCLGGKIVERWGTHCAINRMQQMGLIDSDNPVYVKKPVVSFSNSEVTKSVRDKNKLTVWQFYHQLVNQRKLAAVDDLMAEDIVDHRDDPNPAGGIAGVKRKYGRLLDAFPDAQALCQVMIAEGNLVFWLGRSDVAHTGTPFLGLPPSGKKMSWKAMALFRLEDGRIKEIWAQHDEAALMRQLGRPLPGHH